MYVFSSNAPIVDHERPTFPVAYFNEKVNPSVAKPPLNFNGSLPNLRLTFLVK